MPAVAAIPSLSLLAGCALALLAASSSASALVASFPSYLAAEVVLAFAALAAVLAWLTSCSRVFVGAVVAGFFGGGVLLGTQAWHEAWRPPLRAAFEAAERAERLDAVAAHRPVSAEIAVPMAIAGVLRADASPTDTGASLSVEVDEVEGEPFPPKPKPKAGVLLTVVGDAARASVGEWRAGRRIQTTALLRRPSRYLDPGVPDEERLLARRGTTLVGTVKSAALVDVVARGSALAEAAASVRAFVRRQIGQAVGRWDAQAGAIVAAIVIGDRAGLDDRVQQSLQEAGTYHVIAISGGNIAILAGLTLLAFRVAGVLGRAAMLSAIAGLVAYAYLVGGGASVDRATLMAVCYFAGRAIDHRSSPFNTLAVVAGLMAACDPLVVADPAFLLTFGATAAILAVMPVAAAAPLRPVWLAPAVSMLAASAASEAALLPVSVALFSRITFAGLALNFAAIPLMAVAQIAGMALVPAALVSARLAGAIGWIAYAGAHGLVLTARLVRFVPAVTWRVAAPGAAVIVAYYTGLICTWILWRCRAPARVRAAAAACACASALWVLFEPWRAFASRGDGRLHVVFVDVGQGDAALVRFPRGGSLLVDTGGLPGSGSFDIGDRVVAPVLRDAGVRRLQTLALTHGDNDHIGGAPAILAEFRPADLWEGIPVPLFEPLRALHAAAADTRTRWTTVQTGDETLIDGVRLIVRHPPPPDWERQRVRNDDSIVIELMWNAVSVVLTGDIGVETERLIASRFEAAPLRVVKVPHHGSGTSSSMEFLQALAPRVAVVSVGRSNTFGHPSPAVLARYRAVGAEIFRTDRDGAVMLDTDGETVHVRTFTGGERVFEAKSHHEGTKDAKATNSNGVYAH